MSAGMDGQIDGLTAQCPNAMNPPSESRVSHLPADTSQDLLDCSLGDLLRRNAAEVPDRIALVEGIADASNRRRWTYRELVDVSERAARGLLEIFVPGERVAFLAPDKPEWVILQHAVSFAGLVLVPINPAYTARELEFVLNASEASGLIFAASSRGKNLRALVDQVRPRLPALRVTIEMEKIDTLLASANPDRVLPDVKPGQTLQLQYTSGTTGFPKGACLHHLGVINTSRNVALRANFPDGGVWLNAMPMYHIAGDVVAEIGAYSMRGTFVLMPEFDPGLMLELIETERCIATLIVPTMILALLDHPDRPTRDCASLKTILSGASNVPAALVRRAQGALDCQFCIIFGQTESNGPITLTSPDDSVEDQTTTVGRPLPHVEVKIVDPATEVLVRLEAVGEIWVRGYQTMAGYFGQAEASALTMRPDGWLRTGDLGTMDGRGYLKITGRLKDMIIRGGMKLYPKEIEDVLFDHPDVSQISVLGVPDDKWGEIVAAVILPKDVHRPPSVDRLFQHCRENLSPQKTPELWFFVEKYPMTSTGKIQKSELTQLIAGKHIQPVDWVRPRARPSTT